LDDFFRRSLLAWL